MVVQYHKISISCDGTIFGLSLKFQCVVIYGQFLDIVFIHTRCNFAIMLKLSKGPLLNCCRVKRAETGNLIHTSRLSSGTYCAVRVTAWFKTRDAQIKTPGSADKRISTSLNFPSIDFTRKDTCSTWVRLIIINLA